MAARQRAHSGTASLPGVRDWCSGGLPSGPRGLGGECFTRPFANAKHDAICGQDSCVCIKECISARKVPAFHTRSGPHKLCYRLPDCFVSTLGIDWALPFGRRQEADRRRSGPCTASQLPSTPFIIGSTGHPVDRSRWAPFALQALSTGTSFDIPTTPRQNCFLGSISSSASR